MKTLLLMRHAKSSWQEEGQSDHDRPLNDRGKRDAPKMGQWLKSQGIMPDVILTSSAKRAQKTARAVAAAIGCEACVDEREELYEASPDVYVSVLRSLPDMAETVLLVAHEPTISEFATLLARKYTEMPTSAIAYFGMTIVRWQDLSPASKTELRGYWTPRELD